MNFKIAKIAFAATLALAAFQAVPAVAFGHITRPAAPIGGLQVALLPPVGMMIFCRGHSGQCRSDNTSIVPMTPNLLAMLKGVNTRVNRSIAPRNDRGRDVWSVNVASGDCEDYALTKRAALIRSGVPAGALRIATTHTPWGEGHAILVVKTSRGDFVLDNLRADVRSLGSSGYHINMISTANPQIWSVG